jgi:hypothetical protein
MRTFYYKPDNPLQIKLFFEKQFIFLLSFNVPESNTAFYFRRTDMNQCKRKDRFSDK